MQSTFLAIDRSSLQNCMAPQTAATRKRPPLPSLCVLARGGGRNCRPSRMPGKRISGPVSESPCADAQLRGPARVGDGRPVAPEVELGLEVEREQLRPLRLEDRPVL